MAIVYGVIALIVNISPTHILHPGLSSHARFHVMWRVSVNSMLVLLSVPLIWRPRATRRCRLKIVFGCVALGGFFVAALPSHLLRFERFPNRGHCLIADASAHSQFSAISSGSDMVASATAAPPTPRSSEG